MDINSLVKITSRAWSLTILAALHTGVPGRQAPLLAASGAGRTAFGQSLQHLVEIGMLERNPGYGHPLRPEFRLTLVGEEAAAAAHRILVASDGDNQVVLRRSWTVPILVALPQPCHFNQIKRGLPQITDRALSQSLRSIESCGWIRRQVDISMRPPRSIYQAVGKGLAISAAASIKF